MGTDVNKPWEGRLTNALCKTSTLVATPDGVIPTVVIANTSDPNGEKAHPDELRGIVFHGYKPVELYSVASDEIDSFKTWVALRFQSVQIVTPGTTTCGIICPPPPKSPTSAPGTGGATTEEAAEAAKLSHDLLKADAQTCAQKWFVPPSRPT